MTAAQQAWAATPIRARLDVIRRVRHALADGALEMADLLTRPEATAADVLVAEVMPLLAACRFLEQRAARILRTRQPRAGRPVWLFGTRLMIRRVPFGTVLVIGPGNYPLLLPAVQAMQALTAGNAVQVKPAPGWSAPLRRLGALLEGACLPPGLFQLLPDTPEAGRDAIRGGVDLILLTGSSATGRAVLAEAAPRLTPTIMELSGDDPFIILPGADREGATHALAFGRAFNGGKTCIAPRRVIVDERAAAVAAANDSPYALGAAVFGPPGDATWVAARLRAGCVVVNDVIAPTADPRLPFGGAGESGFGTTRGAEGLLALTRPQAVIARQRPERRHMTTLPDRAAPMVASLLRVAYGPFAPRAVLAALRALRGLS